MSIYFDGSAVGIQIQSIEYQPSYTIENMYQYIQQFQIDISQFCLTPDGSNILNPQDTTQIGTFMAQNSCLYIIQQPQPLFTIFCDGQQIISQQLPNMAINELLTYLQQNGVNLGQNLSIDFYDGNSQPLAQNVDINQALYTYTQGNQSVILNITQIQQEVVQPKGSSNKVTSQKANIGASELLSSLILLKNLSLLMDPNGQFVVYKFHFPTLVQGYLQKSKGLDPQQINLFSWMNQDWQERNNIKYCSFDDYGFAVTWEDGKISCVKIKQQ